MSKTVLSVAYHTSHLGNQMLRTGFWITAQPLDHQPDMTKGALRAPEKKLFMSFSQPTNVGISRPQVGEVCPDLGQPLDSDRKFHRH